MQNIFNQGHPKGLYLLFLVEMWERFSYYGMRALIVLYMVQNLMFSTQKAGNIYGFYTGFVYLTPIIGGYIADKYWGQRRCITLGACFMALGLFLLPFAPSNLFLFPLFLMIIANGFFKSNISSTLGLLYGEDNTKKDSAFTIFYMGINLGALLSPLVCCTLAVKYGYEYGFFASGLGMLIGLSIYKIFEKKLLGNVGLRPAIKKENAEVDNNISIDDKNKLASLIILMLFTIPFWICFEQAGSSLTLFAEYSTNRFIFGKEIPTGYFQSLNPFFIIILAPIMSFLWEHLRQNSKEPGSVEKFGISLLLMSISYGILSYMGYLSEIGKVSLLWLVLVYFLMTVSELCISPIGLSLVSKLAPKRMISLMMGTWFLTSFFGNLIAGYWGGKFETMSSLKLFGALGLMVFITFLILIFCIPRLNKIIK